MQWTNLEIGKMHRETNFPFQVISLYFSRQLIANRVEQQSAEDLFEVSIRLESAAEQCLDCLDGIPCRLSFPNVVLKRPRQHFTLISPKPRDTIAFLYPAEIMPRLRELGFLPEKPGWSFPLTSELQKLIDEFRKCIYHLYTPGTPDQLDWVCFKLLRELCLLQRVQPVDEEEKRIRNIAIWFQLHYHEVFNLEEIAVRYGLSRATFFRLWKKNFSLSPVQYLLNLKLEAAALQLRQTSLSIVQIARNVHFSGMDAFHRKFQQKYGMTPAEYRWVGKEVDSHVGAQRKSGVKKNKK